MKSSQVGKIYFALFESIIPSLIELELICHPLLNISYIGSYLDLSMFQFFSVSSSLSQNNWFMPYKIYFR